MHHLRLDRADGWPNGVARVLLGAALVACLLDRFVGMLLLSAALALFAWRRGITVDRQRRTLSRWWGFGVPGHVLVVREVQTVSLEGFGSLRVAGAPEHYKQWRRNLFHYQLEKVSDTAGEVLPLRPRIVVDDEFSTPQAAWQEAQKVAEFLDVPLASLAQVKLKPALPSAR